MTTNPEILDHTFWHRALQSSDNKDEVITQYELAQYRELKNLSRGYDQIRKEIRRKYLEGATIESGPLSLNVTEMEQRRFTFARISELLGEEEARRLQSLLEPIPTVQIQVIEETPDATP